MAPDDNTDLAFVLKRLDAIQAEQRYQRAEMREAANALMLLTRSVSNLSADIRSLEGSLIRRFDAARDELELVIKSELGGRFANLETRLEDRIDTRFEDLERRIAVLESRP